MGMKSAVLTSIGVPAPVPAPFTALTVNVYAVSKLRPVMRALVPSTTAVPPPVTLYPVGVPPPLGGNHDRLTASAVLPSTRRPRTVPGVPVVASTVAASLIPATLLPETENVYVPSSARPDIEALVPVTAAAPPPPTAYTAGAPPVSGIAQESCTASALTEPMRNSLTGPGTASTDAVVTSRLAAVPEPASLYAFTLNVYAVSAANPAILARVASTTAVPPPVRLYSVGVPPPEGAVHDRSTVEAVLASTFRPLTAPGVPAVTPTDAASPVPAELLPVTANVYEPPSIRPAIEAPVPDTVAVPPPATA